MRLRKSLARLFSVLLPLCVAFCLAGCGKFFVPQNSGDGGGGGGTGTGNYFYVGNETTDSVGGFALGTSGMTNTSNSPYRLGVPPSAMAVTPNGKYLYVASEAGAIYGFSVGSNGALSLLNGGSALISSISPTALRVDPSGNWLIVADPTPEAAPLPVQARRSAPPAPKIGRNDPCPCGSGKKFKKCHGAILEEEGAVDDDDETEDATASALGSPERASMALALP